MKLIHSKRVDDLIEIFPFFIDIIALWPYFIQTGVFNQDDCNIPAWRRSLKNPDTIEGIFSSIKTSGPDAYNNSILSLRLSDHIFIADMLDTKNWVHKTQKE